MENQFVEMNAYLQQNSGKNGRCGTATAGLAGAASLQSSWVLSLAAADRVLVILIENGGVDLGIPTLVDKILSAVPGAGHLISDELKQKLVNKIRDKLKTFTDNLLESAELSINRYSSAKPNIFGEVVILRDGTASYQDLKRTLLGLARAGKVVDLIILTHGSSDFVSVTGGINGQKIRDMKAENGKPLTIRSVYMMNCVGSSLNQAWIDAGAKVSSGALKNNYLPEPTMFFFWKNWKDGQTFENAATSAYRKTINLMNEAAQALVAGLPIPGAGLLASQIDFENLDFVKDSAPVIQGQRSVTINSDNLSFTESTSSSLATTVLPVDLLMKLSETSSAGVTISQQGIDFIKSWEGFRSAKYNDPAGHCTIGYGTLLHKGSCDGSASEQPYVNGISEEDATKLLAQKASEYQKLIDINVSVALNQNQDDALVSFVYNVGGESFLKSTLLRLLNQGNYSAVPREMRRWTKARQNGAIVDLPGLVKRRNAEAELFQKPVTGGAAHAESMTTYSEPFYDTGEHAIFGEFVNNAVSGPIANVGPLQPTTTFNINSVRFTYGQIITMGDFYAKYDDLANAPVDELNRLKTLIARSENHYKNSILGIGSPTKDVPNAEWGDDKLGIGSRFIDLALKNNSHFAPPPAGTSSTLANNKQSWEKYHSQAIKSARAGKTPAALDAAYPINAFGDHFLTDAFSAGHLINKELVMNAFIKNMMSGNSVSSAGDKLLEKVADASLANPVVKKKLAKWELVEKQLGKHWNLDTAGKLMPDVFYRVLKGVTEDTKKGGQQQIANLAAKAVHDYLNEYKGKTSVPHPSNAGVPVKNNKGNSWNLTGDGTLNVDNMKIIQLAVKQSVENIEDAVRNPNTPDSTYFQRVWDYVPLLTDSTTRAIVDKAVAVYTNPSSPELIAKAINLVEDELDTLIAALFKAGIIQEDK